MNMYWGDLYGMEMGLEVVGSTISKSHEGVDKFGAKKLKTEHNSSVLGCISAACGRLGCCGVAASPAVKI